MHKFEEESDFCQNICFLIQFHSSKECQAYIKHDKAGNWLNFSNFLCHLFPFLVFHSRKVKFKVWAFLFFHFHPVNSLERTHQQDGIHSYLHSLQFFSRWNQSMHKLQLLSPPAFDFILASDFLWFLCQSKYELPNTNALTKGHHSELRYVYAPH